jgi:Lon protease-like protein
MFPLSGVHFPGQDVALHVFEPRYRCLVDDVLAGERQFGTALISAGAEVGGGDRRTNVGTLLSVEVAAPFEDGRWLLVATGVERLAIVEWLTDDPYPVALVEHRPSGTAGDLTAALAAGVAAVRRLRMVLAEFEDTGCCGIDFELAEDPIEASWVLCALAPISIIDQQSLLEETDPIERLERLVACCRQRAADIEQLHRLTDSS